MEYEAQTRVTETHVQTNMRWDPSYIKTSAGILKGVCIIVDLICFICVMSSTPYYREKSIGEWFIFVCMTAFWVSLILLIMYLFHIIEKFHVIPWLMIEFAFYSLWSFFFLTAAIAAATEGPKSPAMAAGAFFGFLAMGLYAVDGFFKFRGWRAGHLAQGERKITIQPGRQTGPA